MPTAGKGCPPDPLTGEIVPLIVVIDDGPGYKSAEFMAFIASGPELRHARTRHYAPEANRVVQRFNRTLKCEHLNRREITDGITQGQHLVDRVRHLQPGSQLRSNGDATLCVCVSPIRDILCYGWGRSSYARWRAQEGGPPWQAGAVERESEGWV